MHSMIPGPVYFNIIFLNFFFQHNLYLNKISLCQERRAIACACATTRLNQLHVQKLVQSNKYYKHYIVRWKIVFTIISLIMKILIFNKSLDNKNLHNNKLHNIQETQVHFLEMSLKFKYF